MKKTVPWSLPAILAVGSLEQLQVLRTRAIYSVEVEPYKSRRLLSPDEPEILRAALPLMPVQLAPRATQRPAQCLLSRSISGQPSSVASTYHPHPLRRRPDP